MISKEVKNGISKVVDALAAWRSVQGILAYFGVTIYVFGGIAFTMTVNPVVVFMWVLIGVGILWMIGSGP